MKTMPIEQISDRSQRQSKIRANKELTLETQTSRTLSGGFFAFINYKLNVRATSSGTSFPGSLILPPPGDERPWERGC